jgi:TPR repeat protein
MRHILAMTLAVLLSAGASRAEDNSNVWLPCYVVTSPEVLAEWEAEAETGSLEAQFCLGVMFELGMEVPQDFERSLHWYRLAAGQGDPIAQSAIGNMYHDGRGVPQDYEEAARWYQLAKAQGSDFVGFNALKTAQSLDRELQFAIDSEKFNRMFKLSLQQDPTRVLINLGGIFESGSSVPMQVVTAHMYYNIACALGQSYGCERRDELANGNFLTDKEAMAPADISEAQRRARVCMESEYKDCD